MGLIHGARRNMRSHQATFVAAGSFIFQNSAYKRLAGYSSQRQTAQCLCSRVSQAHEEKYASSLEAEMEQAKQEARPYRIDKSKLNPVEREKLRLHSRAIPLVADSDPLDIIYEDEDFLVVNKPSFLKMHPSHRFEGGSLLNRAIGHCGFPPRLVHRLDMHTTGVVVLAKEKELCKHIMDQFVAGEVRKEYLCVVDGLCDEGPGKPFTIDAPIQRHSVGFVREVGSSNVDSKSAQTIYTVLDKSTDKAMMLLHAAPQTGRTHQIRLHAMHAGIPIVGDNLYNVKEHELYSSYDEISTAAGDESKVRYADGNIFRKGLMLHAWKISLIDPRDGKRITFCASPPSHMKGLLKWADMSVPE